MFRLSCLSSIALAAACNPYDPDLGTNPPFKCGEGRSCPDGYSCETTGGRDLCVASEPAEIDAGDNFECANDSSIEPNNDTFNAFVTPIPSMPSYRLVGLAICPVGDRDHFRFEIVTNGTDFEATVEGVATRTPLTLQVLNSSGTMIASGAPVAGMAGKVKVELPSGLAVGQYYVKVESPDNTENNYTIDMKICPTLPCP